MAKLLFDNKKQFFYFSQKIPEVAMQCNDWNWVRLINASLDKWFPTFINEEDI